MWKPKTENRNISRKLFNEIPRPYGEAGEGELIIKMQIIFICVKPEVLLVIRNL